MVKKKSVAKRASAKARAGKRVAAKKVVQKKTTKKKVVKRSASKRVSKKGPYTYNTPVGVVARDYNLKSPAAPNMKLGDFLKQQRFYSLAKMLGG